MTRSRSPLNGRQRTTDREDFAKQPPGNGGRRSRNKRKRGESCLRPSRKENQGWDVSYIVPCSCRYRFCLLLICMYICDTLSSHVMRGRVQKCCVYFGAEERSEIRSRRFCCSVGPHYPTWGNALSLCDPEPDSLRRTGPNSSTKSSNSILLAKYVCTGFCLSRSLVWGCGNGACRLPFTCCRPPPGCACTPSLFARTWGCTESLCLIFAPPLRSRAGPLAWVVHRPACTPFASPPFTARVAPPIIPCPLPLCAVPLRAGLPWRMAPLRMAPSARPSPCAHPSPSCTSGMCAKGGAGVVGHANGGGRGAAWVEGGMARRNPGSIARAEERTEGWVRTVPPALPPDSRKGKGGRARGRWRVSQGGEGEQPRQRGLLANGKGGGDALST